MNHSSARNTASLPSPLSTMFSNSVRARGWLRVLLAAVCVLVALGTASLSAQTPSVTFAFANVPASVRVQKTLASGLNNPTGVAVDNAGDVFITDGVNDSVVEIPVGCTGANCEKTVATGVPNSVVAVDSMGNLYVVNNPSNSVVKIPPGCTNSTCQSTVGSDLSDPQSVAVSNTGNVFIADSGNDRIVEVQANCNTCQTTLGSGLHFPDGVAVDGNGNVFIADSLNSRVVEVPSGCTSGTCQSVLATGIKSPIGVGVDGAGDVFVTATSTADPAVEIPAGCATSSCQMQVGSGLSAPQYLAVDQHGNVFIADTSNDRVVEEEIVSVDFGEVNVGSNSSLTLTFNIASDITLGTVPTVVTQGVSGLDFKLDGAATCSGAQTASSTCTVKVQFAPLAPGLRKGAVQLFDSSGNLQATVFIQGTGSAPELAFTPGIQTAVAGGVTYPFTVAVDAAGELFAGYSSKEVAKVPAGCTSASCLLPLGNGLASPIGVAIDGAGDVFIADNANAQVVEVPASCVPTNSCQNIAVSGLQSPEGIAVDGQGNLFVADTEANEILEVPPGCTSSICQIDVLSQNINPVGVTLDNTGDLLFSEISPNQVLELPSVPPGFGSPVTVATGLGKPGGLAVDGAGDIFVADAESTSVLEVPADGSDQTAVGSGLSAPSSLGIDGAGDVFIAASGDQSLMELERSQASPLNFGTVLDGSSSAAQTVTIQNVGNQPLTFTSFTVGTNFQLDPSTTTCSTSSSLAKGATCNIGVICSPTTLSGALTGGLSIFDNTLNQPQGKQEVTLSCTASSQAPLITSVNSTMFPAGAADTFTITASGAPTPSLSLSGALPAGVSFIDNHNGTATLSGTPGTSAGGTYNLTITASNGVSPNASQAFTLVVDQAPVITSGSSATFTPGTAGAFTVTASGSPTPALAETGALPSGVTFVDNHNGTATLSGTPAAGTSGSYSIVITASNGTSPNASQSFTLIVNQASQTISFTLPSSVQAQTTLTLTGTASSGLPVTYTSSTQSVCSVSGSTATFLTSGTCTIVASQAGNSGYNAATPVTASTMVTAAPQTITFTLPSSVQPQTMLTLMGTASSGLPVTYTSSTQSVCSVSGSTATFLTGGTCTIVASQAGNSTYAAATPVAASTKVGQTSQTITFNALPSSALQGSTVTLSATATSGLAVSFTSLTPAVCSVSGSSATLLKAGTCTIQASQPGNASYAPATPVSQSVVVTAAFTITPTPSIETIRRGNIAAFVLELKAASGFSGKVTLSCSGGPSGSYCADFPMTVSFQKGVALAVSGIYFPSSTPPGTYTLTFTGTSGSVSNTATAEFIVTQ